MSYLERINKMNVLEKRTISEKALNSILEIIREKSSIEPRGINQRTRIKLENLMIKTYLGDPYISYSMCRKTIQSMIPEYALTDASVRIVAEDERLSEREVRKKLAEWAYDVVKNIYEGMTGDTKALENAKKMVYGRYSETEKYHFAQEQFVLHAMFMYIPDLMQKPEREMILKLGRKYCVVCLRTIISSICYDIAAPDDNSELDNITDLPTLRRAVYMARQELNEYRGLVEAGDAEFEDKLDELKNQELSAFFSALNNEKYGFLIDTLYLQKRAFTELKKDGEKIPYIIEGAPAFIDRLMSFLRDSGINPASKFAPHTTQYLTLEEMEGCRFEPSSERTAPIGEKERVKVKVISSGWKLKDTVISYPILQEDE